MDAGMFDGKQFILALRRRWHLYAVLGRVMWATALTAVIYGFLTLFLGTSILWALVLFVIILAALLLTGNQWRVNTHDVTRYLDQKCPELQESSWLLLKPETDLNVLEKIQAAKLQMQIRQLRAPIAYRRSILRSSIAMAIAIGVACLLVFFLRDSFTTNHLPASTETIATPTRPSTPAPGIRSANIRIVPPAYTGRKVREQENYNIEAEEGAILEWILTSSANTIIVVFNDTDSLSLSQHEPGQWRHKRTANRPGFYQLIVDNKPSDLYQISVLPDRAPDVSIKSPAPNLVLEAGRAPVISLIAEIRDDYGISDITISATVARGKGEGVKFSEKKLAFPGFSAGNRNYQLQRKMNLYDLEMASGDELYYFVTATDNKGQQSRTDVYIISLPDTAELLSLDGLVSGVNLVPEYFRSQRQIIIDAEKLLKEQDTIARERFNARSNNLGIDQKLLRLRYGKFLGEESETTIGEVGGDEHDHDHEGDDDHDHGTEQSEIPFGDASALLEQYGHSHDNAEDATFFEPELKAQLKATLTEMWNSELKLRTYAPREALPYAYKALRLLKDLQQKSRVYVAKTGFNPTPLKPENRLTGELDKVLQPVTEKEVSASNDETDALRRAISAIDLLKTGNQRSSELYRQLQEASRSVTARAVADPATYLDAASALRRILERYQAGAILPSDIRIAQEGLARLAEATGRVPASPRGNSNGGLSEHYFRILKEGDR